MKHIIAEIDSIAGYIETFDEPWCYMLVSRLNRVAQDIEESGNSNNSKYSKIKDSILNQYFDNMIFLGEKEEELTHRIKKHASSEAPEIYKKLKKYFGSLSKKEATDFIKNVLNNLNFDRRVK